MPAITAATPPSGASRARLARVLASDTAPVRISRAAIVRRIAALRFRDVSPTAAPSGSA